MKPEPLLWAGVGTYFTVIGVTYMLVGGEPIGVALLLMATAIGGLIAGWAWDWGRKHGTRAEDRNDADVTDVQGVVGVYSTASLRPITMAIGVTAIVLGLALGSWMTIGGVAIVASQALLLVYDADT